MRKLILLLVAAVCVSTVASAQTVKLGRVNSAQIIELMPEADTVKMKIEARQKELMDQLSQMQNELQRKATAYEQEAPNLTGIIAEQRRKDVIDLQTKLENFSREAQNDLVQYQNLVSAPLFTKVQDAIDKVSKLNLISFVIDESAQPVFVYMDKAAFKDLTPLVKAELKIK